MPKIDWEKILEQVGFMNLDWSSNPESSRMYIAFYHVCTIITKKIRQDEKNQK